MLVGRRADGSIYGTWACPQPRDADHPNMEELPDTHPDVVEFLTRPRPGTRTALRDAIDAASNMNELKQAVKQALNL